MTHRQLQQIEAYLRKADNALGEMFRILAGMEIPTYGGQKDIEDAQRIVDEVHGEEE